jgi:hypothetical protein
MELKPMGPTVILIDLIDRTIKELKLIRQEAYSTLPKQKPRPRSNEIIDPMTGKPFVLKRPKPFGFKKPQLLHEG